MLVQVPAVPLFQLCDLGQVLQPFSADSVPQVERPLVLKLDDAVGRSHAGL